MLSLTRTEDYMPEYKRIAEKLFHFDPHPVYFPFWNSPSIFIWQWASFLYHLCHYWIVGWVMTCQTLWWSTNQMWSSFDPGPEWPTWFRRQLKSDHIFISQGPVFVFSCAARMAILTLTKACGLCKGIPDFKIVLVILIWWFKVTLSLQTWLNCCILSAFKA